ncbi:hypothetical protein QBC34DRAFT_374380 [Podospora aff. communis PSN243]|uniref:Uncharacterized protein n=1 Tax=Podospora aff. communis PSN243 TaxID=3040156 RepID=A0AAV9H5I0_9PEZI|nr:hypothetical protein QBC34DRAFT_374380 [Podospora aff. communis PSN243]
MVRKLANMYSPYQRSRHSSRLVILWVACFFLIVFLTWYLNSRRGGTAARYTSQIVGTKPGTRAEMRMKGGGWRKDVLDD